MSNVQENGSIWNKAKRCFCFSMVFAAVAMLFFKIGVISCHRSTVI